MKIEKLKFDEKLKIIFENENFEKIIVKYMSFNDFYDRKYFYSKILKDLLRLIIKNDCFKLLDFKLHNIENYISFEKIDTIYKNYVDATKSNRKNIEIVISENIFFYAKIDDIFFTSLSNLMKMLPGYLTNKVPFESVKEQFNYYSESLKGVLETIDVFISMIDLEIWNCKWKTYRSLEARNWIVKELFEDLNGKEKLKLYKSFTMLDLLNLTNTNNYDFDNKVKSVFRCLLKNHKKTFEIIEKINRSG